MGSRGAREGACRALAGKLSQTYCHCVVFFSSLLHRNDPSYILIVTELPNLKKNPKPSAVHFVHQGKFEG